MAGTVAREPPSRGPYVDHPNRTVTARGHKGEGGGLRQLWPRSEVGAPERAGLRVALGHAERLHAVRAVL
eukprot:13021901-Alexandrium_andersonii.AAC.1